MCDLYLGRTINCLQVSLDAGFSKVFKAAITNVFKEPKETIFREFFEIMTTMNQ